MKSDTVQRSPAGLFTAAAVLLAISAMFSALVLAPSGVTFADHKPGHGQGKGGGGGDDPPPPPPPSEADPAIAFTTGNGTLVVMNEDGSHQTVIASGLFAFGQPAAWSPDMDGDTANGYQGTLAFARSAGGGAYGVWLCDLRVVNGVPTALRQRLVVADAAIDGFSFSPDLEPDEPGYQGVLIYTRYAVDWNHLVIGAIEVEWDGVAGDPSTIESVLVEPIFDDPMHSPFLIDPVWSADGTRIAFTSLVQGGEYHLFVLDDLADPEPRLLVTTSDVGGHAFDPAWSRTSNAIVFRTSSTGALWTIDADDPMGTLAPVGVAGIGPSWSPDDTALVYSKATSPGNTQKVFRYEFGTGGVTLLAGDNKVHYRNPTWRPF